MKAISLIINLILIIKYICKEPIQQKNEKNKTSYFDNSFIETISDKNFDRVMNAGITNDYLILFTIKKCQVCDQVIKILEDSAKLYLNTDSNVTFYKIDVSESGWTTLRFGFDKLPNIIYVSRGKYSIYPLDNITVEEIVNFIDNKNKDMVKLPKKVGYLHLILKTFELMSYMLSQKFSFWDESYYWILIVGFILAIILFEFIFIKFCCPRLKKDRKTNNECNCNSHSKLNHVNKKHKTKSD